MSKFQDDLVDCYGACHEVSLVVLLKKHHMHCALELAKNTGSWNKNSD